MAKRKRTNNDLQNITQKTKDRATQTPLKTGGEFGCISILYTVCKKNVFEMVF